MYSDFQSSTTRTEQLTYVVLYVFAMRILKNITDTIPNACKFRKILSETGEGFTLERSDAYWTEFDNCMTVDDVEQCIERIDNDDSLKGYGYSGRAGFGYSKNDRSDAYLKNDDICSLANKLPDNIVNKLEEVLNNLPNTKKINHILRKIPDDLTKKIFLNGSIELRPVLVRDITDLEFKLCNLSFMMARTKPL